jgi:hypothetical protein
MLARAPVGMVSGALEELTMWLGSRRVMLTHANLSIFFSQESGLIRFVIRQKTLRLHIPEPGEIALII